MGFLTGLFVGILPGVYFGPLGTGSWLGLIGLPIGKSLTGFTAGLLYKILDVDQRHRKSILTVVLPKAWAEIVFMSLLMAALVGNNGFSIFIANFFARYKTELKS